MCNIEKHVRDFHTNYAKCKECNSKKGIKRYNDNKDKISNQRKIYCENIEHKILQQ